MYIYTDLTNNRKILEVSTQLFMTYGLKSVSMDDICRKLGISKKTIYQYVDNKQELVSQVIKEFIGIQHEMINSITSRSEDAVEEYLNLSRHFLSTIRQMKPTITYDLQKYYPDSWKIVTEDHFKFLQTVIQNNINGGIEQGLYRENINVDIIAKLYISKNHALANEELFPTDTYNKDDLLIEFIRYHLHGIASDKGIKRMKKILKKQL